MELKRIETPGIAHYAYLLSDGGWAVLVDPRRDVQDYLEAARALGVCIAYIIETHRQEDFVMGAAHLARRTGAKIVNGDHALFGHGDLRLKDGDTFVLGSLTLRALATPGHTPESMSYAVYTGERESAAACVFTGDALFFGSSGRTDLTDPHRTAENARVLYDSVHAKLGNLGDTALVLPAHGPGSVCGSGMDERPYSTIGEEKRRNPIFTLGRDAFVQKKRSERIPRPPYFSLMEKVNLCGGLEPRSGPSTVRIVDAETFGAHCERGLIIDTREPEAFAGGHIENAYSVWLAGLPVFGGWVADADSRVYLVTDRNEDVDRGIGHLSRIGIDGVEAGLAGGFGALEGELDALALDPQAPTVVTCSIGHRSGLGTSILLRRGFKDVRNLLGGMTAWRNLDLPTE